MTGREPPAPRRPGSETTRAGHRPQVAPRCPTLSTFPGSRQTRYAQPRTQNDCNPAGRSAIAPQSGRRDHSLSGLRRPTVTRPGAAAAGYGVLSQTLVGSNCWIAGTYTAL